MCPGADNCMTRIETVKQLFHAFSNRSQAYGYAHCIGLVNFGTFEDSESQRRQSFECTLTELFENFKVSTTGALHYVFWISSHLLE